MRVGFIGLGRMGQGMARRLLGAGHELSVFDMVAAATMPFGEAGARVASSIHDLCAGRDVVVTMLVEDRAILEVALGAGGLCDSLPRGAIHLVMGTHGVATVRQLEARHRDAGQTLVAAPVLGRPDLAASGQLGIVAGGPDDAVRTCGPLLSVMGRKTFPAGAKPESATAIKLAEEKGGTIHALHVIKVPLSLALDAELVEQEERATASLEDARTLATEHGVTIEGDTVRARAIGEAIAAKAKEIDADLIVMGSAPRWRRQSRFFSPTVDYVLRSAPCEVMVLAYPQGILEEELVG